MIGVILNVLFCCLPGRHDIPTRGPCKGPGVGGQQGWSERSQEGWSEWGPDQPVGSSKLFGVVRAVLPQGAARELTLVPSFPPAPLWETQTLDLPETAASLVRSFANTISCAITIFPAPCWGGSEPQHPWEDRVKAPQCPGEVAMAISCHPAGQLVSAHPSASPPPGFPVCAALAQLHLLGTPWRVGGSAFLCQTLELPVGPGQAPLPPLPPPTVNIWLGGRRLEITGGQGGLRVTDAQW